MEDPGQSEDRELPLSLRVVAYVTIFFGACTAIQMVVALFQDRFNINLGVIQIPAGFGLLRLSRGWRTFVLFFAWVGGIGSAIVLLATAFKSQPPISIIPGPLASYGRELMMTYCAAALCYCIWEYRVLTNPRIRRLFRLPP